MTWLKYLAFGQVNLKDFEGYIPHIIVLNKRRVHPFREYNITKYNTKLWDQHMNFQLKIAFLKFPSSKTSCNPCQMAS